VTGQIEEVIGALERASVRYLVVGGVAVVIHGYLRATADLDLVLDPAGGNMKKALSTLRALDFRPRVPIDMMAFTNRETLERWRQERNMHVLSLWSAEMPGFEVDILLDDLLDFEAARERATIAVLATTRVCVAGIDDLIAMKRRSQRALDLEDVEALEELRRLDRRG
jgi:hypothetical protein